MRNKYRIVTDGYAGYEVQSWRWWFPFWVQCSDGGSAVNTHRTVEQAREFVKKKQQFVVEVFN